MRVHTFPLFTWKITLFYGQPYANWLLSSSEEIALYILWSTDTESRQSRELWRKWKKVNIMCSSSNIFLEKISFKPRIPVINIMGIISSNGKIVVTLFHCGYTSPNNARFLDHELRSLFQKKLKKKTIWFWSIWDSQWARYLQKNFPHSASALLHRQWKGAYLTRHYSEI